MDYNECLMRYLQQMSKQYKNIKSVTEEIINLQAILNLPKGTEVFLSDIHGEYGSFSHILNNGSGIIRSKIEDLFSNTISEKERRTLATLIYYPEEKLNLIKKNEENLDEWYALTLYRLVLVATKVSSKYTRSKVRKAMQKGFDYIIDELIHLQGESSDKDKYYKQIINSIIDLQRADDFIVAISNLIKRMAIDHLHIIGDIFDRGSGARPVMEKIMNFHSVDIQWGNHDILWMGAAAGNEVCIASIIRICARYDNLNILEEDYGINIRPLSTFATKTYGDDNCTEFIPKVFEYNKYSNSDKNIIAKIHKAISVIQFKLEGNLIKRHPEYQMEDRLLLDKIDYKKGTIEINNKKYKLSSNNFPTIDKKEPYKLTDEEQEIVERLKDSIFNSDTLNKHIQFLYSHGNVYKIFNSNLLFHGCIPMDNYGNFMSVNILEKNLKGKAYFDYIEEIVRKAYIEKDVKYTDLMWFFWCSEKSPFFGKDKAATFERYFIDDKETHKENKNPYYNLVNQEEICDKILKEFNLSTTDSHIINGHVPVKEKDGESPIRGNGKLLVIDGGFAKSYREQTGRAGYTLTYNSYGLMLSANEPFDSKMDAIINEKDIKYDIMVKPNVSTRKRVADTDIGKDLQNEIEGLKMLYTAYIDGIL